MVRLNRSMLCRWSGAGKGGSAVGDGSFGEQLGELVRGEVRAVVGEDLVDGHLVGPEPVLVSPPEPAVRVGLILIVVPDVHGPTVVADHCVQIGAADSLAVLPGTFGVHGGVISATENPF